MHWKRTSGRYIEVSGPATGNLDSFVSLSAGISQASPRAGANLSIKYCDGISHQCGLISPRAIESNRGSLYFNLWVDAFFTVGVRCTDGRGPVPVGGVFRSDEMPAAESASTGGVVEGKLLSVDMMSEERRAIDGLPIQGSALFVCHRRLQSS